MRHTITTMLFDIDGTLVDSNAAHARAWSAAFAAHGYDIGIERILPLIGMGGDKIMPLLIPGTQSEDPLGKAIGERRKAFFLTVEAPRLQPTPGARALLLGCRERGLGRTIASSAQPDELSVLERAAEIDDLIEERSTAGDAADSKPDPDIVLAALKKSGVDAAQALMVGDTPYDIESAHKAGVAIVAVRTGGWDEAGLAGARKVYADPGAILADLDALLAAS